MNGSMPPLYEYFSAHVPATYALTLLFFGAAVGSFLNVVIFRLPYDISLLSPPSSCPRCGKRIYGLDNLPILSWLILGGRCRHCRAPIPWRYPAPELLTALLWAAAGYQAAAANVQAGPALEHWENIGLLVVQLLFLASLVAIALIDVDHRIIPDELSFGGLVAALIASTALPALHLPYHPEIADAFPGVSPHLVGLLSAFLGALAGGCMLLLVTAAGTLAFRKRLEKIRQTEDPDATTAIGLGDVKLMAFAGALLGWKEILAAFFLGTVVGAVAGIADKLTKGRWPGPEDKVETDFFLESSFVAYAPLPERWRKALVFRWQSGDSLMPYGPALCVGLALVLFFRAPILAWFTALLHPQIAGQAGS